MGNKSRSTSSRSQNSTAVLTTLIDPGLYRSVECLAKNALAFSGNHPTVRSAVVQIRNEMQRAAYMHLGHATPEITALISLLNRNDPDTPWQRPNPQRDPLVVMDEQRKLTPQQMGAAKFVRRIWGAFERFLVMGARDYEKVGGGKTGAKPVGPYEVMGEQLHQEWRKIWAPWYESAQRKVIRGTTIKHSSIVLGVLAEGNHPHQIDAHHKQVYSSWVDGRALSVLQFQLDKLNAQEQLAAAV